MVNLPEHKLVPKHEILGAEEAGSVFKKYKISPRNMPKILKNDPIAKEIGADVGDVIKITRSSDTAGRTEYYRIVVRG